MTNPIDKKIIKKSHTRMVISGNNFELYEYENPFFYNFPPPKRNEGTGTNKPKERRDDNLRRTRDKIRRLTNANANAYGEKLKFFTFTFSENITSVNEGMFSWYMFIKKFKRRRGINLKYLTVIEFQERGAVHFHTLFFNLPFVYGLKDEVEECWTHGFIKIKTLDRVRNIGAYISKYLQKGIIDKRLCGNKAFFTSKGLIQPVSMRGTENIKLWLQKNKIDIEYDESFDSKTLGIIKYKTGKYVCSE